MPMPTNNQRHTVWRESSLVAPVGFEPTTKRL